MRDLLTCEALDIRRMFNNGIYVRVRDEIIKYSFSGLNYKQLHFGIDEKGTFVFLPGCEVEVIYLKEEGKVWSFFREDF